MTKRPLCLLCLCFMAGIWLLEILGLTYGGGPPRPGQLTASAAEGAACQIWGRVERRETKQNLSYLYLRDTVLEVSAKRYSLRIIRIKLIERSTTEEAKCVPGSLVHVRGRLTEMAKATNPGQFDQDFYYAVQEVDALAEMETLTVLKTAPRSPGAVLWEVKSQLQRVLCLLGGDQAGVLSAMVLGEKTFLGSDTKSVYQMGGMMHILAISGMHLSILGAGLSRLLLRLGFGVRSALGLALALMVLYSIFTGLSVSTLRAILMFLLSVGAVLTGRTYDLLSALALSAILILADQPGYLWHSGFRLSCGAVLGLGLWGTLPAATTAGRQTGIRRIKAYCLAGLRACGTVYLMTLPVILSSFYELPLLAPLLNLLMLPALPVILLSGMFGSLAGLWSLQLGALLLGPGRLLLSLYETILQAACRLPFAVWIIGKPACVQLILYGCCLLYAWRLLRRKRVHQRAALFWIAAGVTGLCLHFSTGFSVTMLDVGQGDSLVVQAPGGRHYLVDGGSTDVSGVGGYRILPYLKSRGIQTLDGVFVTHDDKDHTSGILELLELTASHRTALRMKRLFLPCWMEKRPGELQQAARKARVPIVYLQEGMQIRDGELKLQVLHPPRGSDYENGNAGSLTLLAECRQTRVLLTGDLEGEGERQLLESGLEITCEVLKTAHHGSKYSTSEEFLRSTHPTIALISAGAENAYGHPHAETLERLEASECRVWCTRDAGAVAVKADGKRMQVKTYVTSGDAF